MEKSNIAMNSDKMTITTVISEKSLNKENDLNFTDRNRSVSIISDSSSIDSSDSCENDRDIISNYIGDYGLWQFFWTFLLCLFQLPCTFHIFALVFQSANRDFWCARPEHLHSISIELWRNLTQPKDGCTIFDYDFINIHAKNFTNILISYNPVPNLIKCTNFEFDGSLIGDTIISEWNLVCDNAYFANVVEMCFLAGAACGSVCSGWISDRFGRRHTLMCFAFIQTIGGTALAFQSSLTLFMILRFIMGFASMSVIVVSFVLVVELVSGTYRTVIGILNILPVAIAYIITAGISYLAYDWRTMQIYISIPWYLLLLIWFKLPESPRWLLSQGKIEELKLIIERAAKCNKIILPRKYEKTLIPNRSHAPNVSVFDLFRHGYTKTTFLMIIVWFSLILLYFGITLHLNNLGGNVYTNTIIAGSVEAVSICLSIFVVLKLGLRINLFMYMLIAGVACIMVNFAPDNNVWFIITSAMIGKCAIGANNAIIPTFTAFQYPTVMRNLGVGVGNFAAGIALIIVPYLWLLEHIQIHLPMTVMGVVGIIGAIALYMMNDNSIKKSPSQQRVIDNECGAAVSDSSISIPKNFHGADNEAYIENETENTIDTIKL